MKKRTRIIGYTPEKPVEHHTREIVTELLNQYNPIGRYDAEHIVSTVMSVVPDHKIGSIMNRSVAAAAIWNVSRICSLNRKDGIPLWIQREISMVAGVSEGTIRTTAKLLREI